LKSLDVLVPDLGDFKNVPVVDVLVKSGDRVRVDDPLVTLETDKASMDVPSTFAGVVERVLVGKGDRVSRGTAIVRVRVEEAQAAVPSQPETEQPYVDTITIDERSAPGRDGGAPEPSQAAPKPQEPPAPEPRPARESGGDRGRLVVLGAGPGGYTAAFRAADLGMKVTLIERWPTLGGVCLNVGCIPSKALLHAARVIEEVHSMEESGLRFGAPQIDHERLRAWKNKVVGRLTSGLAVLARQRKVEVVHGTGRFLDAHHIEVTQAEQKRTIEFDQCIVAAGSEPARLAGLPDDNRIFDSTGALELPANVKRLLVIGGGIIGLEMACVYDGMGVKVSVVELTDQLIPGCDPDLVKPLQKRIQKRYEQILTGTRVEKVEARREGLRVTFGGGAGAPAPQVYDRVLVAVGRSPNGQRIGAAAAGVNVDERGFIPVDRQMRTNVAHIFAIGDIAGNPMLAHKASHEGKVAAEVASGEKRAFEARVIPSVAYTDPEIAWAGLTETDAKKRGVAYEKGSFPWLASARSLTLNRDDGFTKLLFDPQTHRLLGAGIVGTNAGDLIAEAAHAIEMGSDAADIGMTIHPHPTLSETLAFAAEAHEGTLTDLYLPKR
jgi:dihydrolipoamide dehydrogenase